MITHSVIYILWSLLYYTTFERYGQLGESVLAITWHIYREENCIFFPSAKSSGMICLYKSDIWHRTLWLIFPTDSGMIIIQENVRISLLQIICYWGGVVMATTSITKEFFCKRPKCVWTHEARFGQGSTRSQNGCWICLSEKEQRKISYLCISLRAPLARTSEHGQVDRLRCPRFFLVR